MTTLYDNIRYGSRRLPGGFVYLVGAGPGDPELITLRGLRALSCSDVVLYDALLPPGILEMARPGAQLIPVGKRGYCVGSTTQESIHDLLIDHARVGRVVCRLKGGDPCVFGRGGEEALALAAAGIPFEVVPGVTAALAACAAAGIPATHREAGSSLALVSAHVHPDAPDCRLDWPALARMSTVVFYMGLRHVEAIAARLIACGRDPGTPAAVLASATTPAQRVVEGPLDRIGRLAREHGIEPPALLVVGETVEYRARLGSGAGRGDIPTSAARDIDLDPFALDSVGGPCRSLLSPVAT